MSKPKLFKNFINGEWVESSSGETTENRNPANTDEVLGLFQKSNADDISNAIGDGVKKTLEKMLRITGERKEAAIAGY